jgi:hypothetical protein
MTYRINRCRIELEIYEPLCGVRTLQVDYPPPEGDAFAAAAVDKWRAEYVNAHDQDGESKWPMQL